MNSISKANIHQPWKALVSLLTVSQSCDTMGMPLPMAQRNLAVRRILSVMRTEQSQGLVVSLPPTKKCFNTFFSLGK